MRLHVHEPPVVAEERLRGLAASSPPAAAVAAGRLIERQRLRRSRSRDVWNAAWTQVEKRAKAT
jgi:hypothetical protein